MPRDARSHKPPAKIKVKDPSSCGPIAARQVKMAAQSVLTGYWRWKSHEKFRTHVHKSKRLCFSGVDWFPFGRLRGGWYGLELPCGRSGRRADRRSPQGACAHRRVLYNDYGERHRDAVLGVFRPTHVFDDLVSRSHLTSYLSHWCSLCDFVAQVALRSTLAIGSRLQPADVPRLSGPLRCLIEPHDRVGCFSQDDEISPNGPIPYVLRVEGNSARVVNVIPATYLPKARQTGAGFQILVRHGTISRHLPCHDGRVRRSSSPLG